MANRSILKTFIYRGNMFNKTVNLSYGPHTDITLIQCNYKYTLYNTIGLQCGVLTTNVFWKLRTYQMLKKMKRTCAHITFFFIFFFSVRLLSFFKILFIVDSNEINQKQSVVNFRPISGTFRRRSVYVWIQNGSNLVDLLNYISWLDFMMFIFSVK